MNFIARLKARWGAANSLLCVGLDPDPAKFPGSLRAHPQAMFEFSKAIIEATHDLACAFKPQIAYYAARRAEDQLQRTLAHILRERIPASRSSSMPSAATSAAPRSSTPPRPSSATASMR